MHLIYVTFPHLDDAKKIIKILLEENLIACANVFSPHIALYEWEGKIMEEQEVAALLKTTSSFKVETRIVELHPYECPCIIGIEPDHIHQKFKTWITECVEKEPLSF